jgi:general secretion pathway protein K
MTAHRKPAPCASRQVRVVGVTRIPRFTQATRAARATPATSQRGAALLIAMLILTLVATVASAMVWHQQRAIEVEAAERARAQAAAILVVGVDWLRSLLPRNPQIRFPPAEARTQKIEEFKLSSFLAVDRDNNADLDLEIYGNAEFEDAQSRYNLRWLVGDDGKPVPAEVAAFQRLCDAVGASSDIAERVAEGLAAAWYSQAESAPLPPTRVEQLTWLGLDNTTVDLLLPHVIILPTRTPLNANTASEAALMSAFSSLDAGSARSLKTSLERTPAANPQQLKARLAEFVPEEGSNVDASRVGVGTSHFLATGRLRADQRILELKWLVQRRSTPRGFDLVVLRREQRTLLEPGG